MIEPLQGTGDAAVFNADDRKVENGRKVMKKWMPISVLVTIIVVVSFLLALPLMPFFLRRNNNEQDNIVSPLKNNIDDKQYTFRNSKH